MINLGKIDYSSHWYTDDQLSYLEKGPARHHNRKRIAYLIKTIEGFGFKSPKILDAGCGDGAMTRYFLRVKGAQITGLDYNELRLERARKLMPELNFVKG
ncbi:MAG: class I SAM-dependent methyltransferase, partial [Candidatus Micrarchaeia archaeon]